MSARLVILFSALAALRLCGQGAFQNLSFESAVIIPIPGDFNHIQFVPAFPGWTGTINGQQQTAALYNSQNLSGSEIALLSSAYRTPYEGSYTLELEANSLVTPRNVSLYQTGFVPNDARSLRFLGTTPAALGSGQLTVSLNGTPLSLFMLQNFGGHALYTSDVSSFAGQSAELRFTDSVPSGGFSYFSLDAINFSPVAVPEPGTWALLALGSVTFWCAARRPKK